MTINNAVNVGLSGSTGTGNFVGANTPTLITPLLGTPTSGNLVNCTGYPVTVNSQILSLQTGGDTNDSSSGSGAYRNYNLAYNIPSSTLTASRLLRVSCEFNVVTGSAPTGLTWRLQLANTTIWAQTNGSTPAANWSQGSYVMQWYITATQAPGATVPVGCSMAITQNVSNSAIVVNVATAPPSLATNGTLNLTVATQWVSAGTGTNQITLRTLMVEQLG